MNDHREVSLDAGVEVAAPRVAKMELVRRWNPVLVYYHVTLPFALELVATQRIERGAEMFFFYGEEYA